MPSIKANHAASTRPFPSLLIAAYLAFQVLLPLRGWIATTHDSRAGFSWNVYYDRFVCESSYLATYADGRVVEIDHSDHVPSRGKSRRAFYRDRLPAYHAFLCGDLAAAGELEGLEGICLCSYDEITFAPLVRDDAEFCSAENRGVLEP